MPFQKLGGLVCFNATAQGTGDFLVASAYTGCVVPEQAGVTNGKTYTYYAQSADGTQWEKGSGAYNTTTHTLSRTTIQGTSNGDQNPVNFTTVPIVNVFASASPTLETPFPSGTVMLFQNATAPVSWTRISTYDDCAIRIVGTATPGSGGSNGFSTVFAQTVVGNTTLSAAQMPSHQHAVTEPGGDAGFLPSPCNPNDAASKVAAGSTGGTGGGGAHNHPIVMQIKYVDFILASKN